MEAYIRSKCTGCNYGYTFHHPSNSPKILHISRSIKLFNYCFLKFILLFIPFYQNLFLIVLCLSKSYFRSLALGIKLQLSNQQIDLTNVNIDDLFHSLPKDLPVQDWAQWLETKVENLVEKSSANLSAPLPAAGNVVHKASEPKNIFQTAKPPTLSRSKSFDEHSIEMQAISSMAN